MMTHRTEEEDPFTLSVLSLIEAADVGKKSSSGKNFSAFVIKSIIA
jgi:hypothetical protein